MLDEEDPSCWLQPIPQTAIKVTPSKTVLFAKAIISDYQFIQ